MVLTSGGTAAEFKSQCNLAPGALESGINLSNYIAGMCGGNNQSGAFAINVGAVSAAGTIVFASTGPANTQTATLLGVTFTALTSGHVSGEATFDRSNTLTVALANLTAAINEYAPFVGIVTAAVTNATTLTITCSVPGTIGNKMLIVNVNWANTTITNFANGLEGSTYYTIDLA